MVLVATFSCISSPAGTNGDTGTDVAARAKLAAENEHTSDVFFPPNRCRENERE